MSEAVANGLVEARMRPPPPPQGWGEAAPSRRSSEGNPAPDSVVPPEPAPSPTWWGETPSNHPQNVPPPSSLAAPRLLVLGLGNDILTDDAIGLRIVRALQPHLAGVEDIDTLETEEMGLSLLDHIVGYSGLVIVDAIQTGSAPAGHLHCFDSHELPSRRTGAPHFLGVGDTLALGRLLDLPMPQQVTILAIEVADPLTLGTNFTPALEGAFPGLVQRVEEAVRAISQGSRSLQAQAC